MKVSLSLETGQNQMSIVFPPHPHSSLSPYSFFGHLNSILGKCEKCQLGRNIEEEEKGKNIDM
jgi:hypothetical protein